MSASMQMMIGMTLCTVGMLSMLLIMVHWLQRNWKRSRQRGNIVSGENNAPPTPHRYSNDLPYERRAYLLTRAEVAFFDVLRAATPAGLVVFPQMRLASIVNVAEQARRSYTHFNRIQAKCVDFVLCDAQTTAPQLVVELDDSSHNRPDRQERDRFVDDVLANAGLPILHVRWQRHYNAEEIARSIRQLLTINEIAPPGSWSKPLSDVPRASAIIPPVAAHYVCGRCQQTVRKDSTFCPHCGAML